MDKLPPPPYPSLVTTGLIAVSAIFPMVSLLSILLRIAARRKARQPIGADDICIFVSWFLTLALSILAWYYAGKTGINYYKTDFLTGTEGSLELIFISSCYVQFPLAAVKIGVLLFYKRIFSTRGFRIAVYVVTALICVWAVLFFLLILLEIDPVAFPLTKTKLLYNSSALGLAQAATSFVLDLIVLSLPFPMIRRLHMQTGRKIAVMLIFSLGAFCMIAAIVRTALLDQSIKAVVASSQYDRVANQSKQFIFMVLEPNVSILAACLPTYGPLAKIRAPESLVRSVRSVFSLQSVRSANSTRNTGKVGTGASDHGSRSSRSDSQVELNPIADWPNKADQEVNISYTVPRASESTRQLQRGISVTNDLTVESKMRDYP